MKIEEGVKHVLSSLLYFYNLSHCMNRYRFSWIVFFFCGCVMVSSCGNKSKNVSSKNNFSAIAFPDTLHDFGIIPLTSPVDSFDFWYKNIGGRPLVVLGLQTSCHCITATYDARPVQPGDSSYVRVTYDGRGRSAEYFEKSVTVYTNASDCPQRLIVRGRLE